MLTYLLLSGSLTLAADPHPDPAATKLLADARAARAGWTNPYFSPN